MNNKTTEQLNQLKKRIQTELKKGILPFWLKYTFDHKKGGFYGKINNDMTIDKYAPKSLILNTRILWSFSSAYIFYQDKHLLKAAQRAYHYLLENFRDDHYGGMYWLLKSDGSIEHSKKQIYGQAFSIYSLSEYYRATKDKQALEYAIKIYHLIEENALDLANNGYLEAFSREWNEISDSTLSSEDMNEKKSMNTHLHLLEAYTTLYSVWQNNTLKERLMNLINITTTRILDKKSMSLNLFFDEYWNIKSDTISFGHNIEATWLIHEAVILLQDEKTENMIIPLLTDMVSEFINKGLDGTKGEKGVFNEQYTSGKIDKNKIWWVQAEACVGLFNIFQLTHETEVLEIVFNIWQYILNNLKDNQYGEWFWYAVLENGEINHKKEKVNEWKGPYHSVRACIELIKRIDTVLNKLESSYIKNTQ